MIYYRSESRVLPVPLKLNPTVVITYEMWRTGETLGATAGNRCLENAID